MIDSNTITTLQGILFGEGGKIISFCLTPAEFARIVCHGNSSHGVSLDGGFYGGDGSIAGRGVAVGRNAVVRVGDIPIDAIQLGEGTNAEVKTLKVYNFELLDAEGVIPEERLPPHQVEFQAVDSAIQWKYVGEDETEWRDLIEVDTLNGEDGQSFQVDEYGDLDEAKVTEIENNVATGRYLFLVNPLGDIRVDSTLPAAIAGDMSRHILMYDGDEAAWYDYGEFTGLQGDPGDPVELRNNGTWVQWKYTTSSTWTNLIELSVLKGDTGDTGLTGQNITLRNNGTHIQWKVANLGDETYANLVALSAITGPAGTPGDDGTAVELQESGKWVQWRYVGDLSWTNLYSINTVSLVNLGTKSADFNVSLIASQMQEVIVDVATCTITFTNLQLHSGTVNTLTITAAQEVTLSWNADIKWVDGEKLTTIANGDTYTLHISTRGDTQAKITMNYVKIE